MKKKTLARIREHLDEFAQVPAIQDGPLVARLSRFDSSWAIVVDEGPDAMGEMFIAEDLCQGFDGGQVTAEFLAAAPRYVEALLNEVDRLRGGTS